MEPLEGRRLLTRFAIAGDFAETSAFNDVAAMMEGWNPAHIISVGDNNNNDDADLEGTIGAKFHEWISPYLGDMGAGSSSGNRFWPVLGNHDWDGGVSNYTSYFTLPNNERYYSVRLNEVEWFMIDSDQREPSGTSSTSTQANWLRNALAASTAPWQIVVFHHPAYSSASTPDSTYMRWPFKDWGADVIMSGHDHLYERLNVNGLQAFIVGTGGAGLHEFGSTDPNSQFRNDSVYGAMRLDATSSSLEFRFYTRSGSLLDSVTLTGGNPQPPPGDSVTFVPTGASWKYLDNGTNQGTAWRVTSFSDSAWKTGNAQLGYGDGDEATVVSYGGSSSNKFVTTYFRKSFNVSSASAVTGLNLRLKRDDGAVVYLNGTEVFRSNMPTGTIGYTTFASSAIEDESYKTATISPSLLTSGTNVIAVEVHQSDRTSSDVSFDFELTGTTTSTPVEPPAAPSGLAASAASASRIDLTWSDNSDNESNFILERSPDGASNWQQIATPAAGATSYSNTGLSAATTYFYRIRAINTGGASDNSNTASATTAEAPPSTLPTGWSSGDIGNVGAPGSATFAITTFSIQASGADVWSTADSFHYVYRSWTGNGQIIARALTPSGPSGGFEGIMFRETTAAGSKHASFLINNGRSGFVRRTSTGGSSAATTGSHTTPRWIKLIRNGSTFTAFQSSTGTTWTQLGSAVTISMTSTIQVGLLGCSTVPGTYGSYAFDGVQTSTSTSSTLAATSSTITLSKSSSLFATTPITVNEDDLLSLVG